MLNYIWLALVLLAVAIGGWNNRLNEVTAGAFDGAKTAVTIALGLIGIMALWLLFISSGEFFVGKVNAWDINADGTKKLTDYQYFSFFTIVMFVASTVFVVLACFYKGRTYLQSQQPTLDEIATEPIIAGGTPT